MTDPLTFLEIDHVDDGTTSGCSRYLGNFEDLDLEDAASVGEAEQVIMGRRYEHLFSKVILAAAGTYHSLAASPLGAVLLNGEAFDVTLVRDGHHHLLDWGQCS